MQTEQNLFRAVSGRTNCSLFHTITPMGAKCQGDETSHLPLTSMHGSDTQACVRWRGWQAESADLVPFLVLAGLFFENIHHGQIRAFCGKIAV